MEGVFKFLDRPVNARAKVAIAVKRNVDNSTHIGILHVQSGSELLLHLEWHCRLTSEAPTEDWLVVNLKINKDRLTQVAAKCRQVLGANARGGIPYGFSEPNDCFDIRDGHYLFGPTKHGLTCSSFVVAIFRYAGVNLVQSNTWPNRSEDAIYQAQLVARLIETNVDADHVDFVRTLVGAIRYRPEEVAGAATIKGLPAHFDQATPPSLEILALI